MFGMDMMNTMVDPNLDARIKELRKRIEELSMCEVRDNLIKQKVVLEWIKGTRDMATSEGIVPSGW